MKIRQPINTEQQNPKDARVRLKNLTPEQVENTIEQERQGNEIIQINLCNKKNDLMKMKPL